MPSKQTTIFNQLILNVVLPTLAALLVMAVINFSNTRSLIEESNFEKNRIISNEITEILELQELAVSVIEKSMSERMSKASDQLVNNYFRSTKNIASADLNAIRDRLGLNPAMEDIYIIDTSGVIVNTTYEKDLGFNLFSIGEEHKNHLMNVFSSDNVVNTRFEI